MPLLHLPVTDKDIDDERGVVLEESRLGKGADDRMLKKYFPKLAEGSLYAQRLPIGKDDILHNFKYDKVRSFYKDWYRPDLMAVIAHYRQPDAPFYLAGFSFGGYTAAAATARLIETDPAQRPTRLVLIGPAVGRFQVNSVPADTIVIHGEHDDVVPLAAVFDWARPQNLPVVVVPGGEHFFHGKLVPLKAEVERVLAAEA